MNVGNLLARAGTSCADFPAVALGSQRLLTYGQLARRAGGIAAALRVRHDLRPGDRVALVMRNSVPYLETLFAIWYAGLIAVPVNPRLHAREIGQILEDCGARLCFVTDDTAQTVNDAIAGLLPAPCIIPVSSRDYAALCAAEPMEPVECTPLDGAWLFYTSGTTGRSKGALLSHRSLMAMSCAYFVDVDTVGPRDSILHAAPLSHGSGLYILPYVAAAATHVVPESGKFDPAEMFDLIASHRGVSFFVAPTMIHRLLDSPLMGSTDTGNLKTIIAGGAPSMPPIPAACWRPWDRSWRRSMVRARRRCRSPPCRNGGCSTSPIRVSSSAWPRSARLSAMSRCGWSTRPGCPCPPERRARWWCAAMW